MLRATPDFTKRSQVSRHRQDFLAVDDNIVIGIKEARAFFAKNHGLEVVIHGASGGKGSHVMGIVGGIGARVIKSSQF